MTRKQQPEPKKVKKLAVKRTTVKDLDVQSKRGDAVRGGGPRRGFLQHRPSGSRGGPSESRTAREREDKMTKKPEPKKVKKLVVKRTTVKDLDVQSKRGDAVRGGGSGVRSGGTV